MDDYDNVDTSQEVVATDDAAPPAQTTQDNGAPVMSQADREQLKKLIQTVKADKRHFEKKFKRMRLDMEIATHGCDRQAWGADKYTANITGRHILQKTATLYAKNPKVVAKRQETLDFQIWDENQQTLLIALQTIQQYSMMAAAGMMPDPAMTGAPGAPMAAPGMGMQPPSPVPGMGGGDVPIANGPIGQVDPSTGMPVPVIPQLPPELVAAQNLVADFQQGMARRGNLKRFGRTLEILFDRAMNNQRPLDFKTAMKQLVRRACTTSVGYIEVGFQREYGPRQGITEKLTDFQQRLAHLENLADKLADGEINEYDAEIAELQSGIAALQEEPEIVLRQGLVFDFPQSTRVIPDRRTKQLVGFVGAQHLALEYMYTPDEVKEIFKVDIGKKYTPYVGGKDGDEEPDRSYEDDQGEMFGKADRGCNDMVCVWKIFDRNAGLVYFVADGFDSYLRAPGAPDVEVSDFWPVYALTFNAVENEKELFPPSDVQLLEHMQKEYNRSRQGKREHRSAARPRWAHSNGAFDDEDKEQLKNADAFDVIGLNIDPAAKIADVLQSIPVPGVDPNLYDTGEIFADVELTVGRQQASFGGLAKATATESAISASSLATADGSNVDDLDAFLTAVARGSAQILMREMDAQIVTQTVGPGAIWIDQTTTDIFDEMTLEVQAGSSGKPNQAVEINNWKEMLPFLLQMGSIPPNWLARETLRRLDDKMDLTEAVVDGIPSIVAQNAQARPSTGNPATDPAQQGGEGAQNAPKGQDGSSGSGPAFGSNQV